MLLQRVRLDTLYMRWFALNKIRQKAIKILRDNIINDVQCDYGTGSYVYTSLFIQWPHCNWYVFKYNTYIMAVQLIGL